MADIQDGETGQSSRKPGQIGSQKMSIVLEMQAGIYKLAGERRPSDTRESMIRRAARAAGISYRQARSFFYAETENPRAKAIEAVREAVAKRDQQIQQQASDELTELRRRVTRLEMLIAVASENLNRAAGPEAR